MYADRLVSLVLLLRQHGRLTAATLAREPEVSARIVLRDTEALSAAGVPVHAERGRHGGLRCCPASRPSSRNGSGSMSNRWAASLAVAR
jgi:predicted DNA-binding transcriptional regulator YafY